MAIKGKIQIHACNRPYGVGCEFRYNGDCIRPDDIDFCVRKPIREKKVKNESK